MFDYEIHLILSFGSTVRGERGYWKNQQQTSFHQQPHTHRKMAPNFFHSKRVYNWYEVLIIYLPAMK